MAKGKKRKKRKALKIILAIVVVLLGALGIVALVYGGSVKKFQKNAKELTKDITADTFRQIETSIVYDINGEEITSLSGIKQLYYIYDEEIPDILKRTFVLLEDRDFYKHDGIDFSAIIRAMIANAKSNSLSEGASTITQQLAKNIFLTQDKTWERKITEMFVAVELEKKFEKDDILEFYINNIYFGHGYYGIEAAAQGYFGKSVGELSLSQLIYLAGMPKNPSRFDPVSHPDKVLERRNFILKQLFADGQISSLEYYEAVEEPVVLVDSTDDRYNYVDTYVFYCATVALMEHNGFVFREEFASEEDKENYEEKYDEWYSKYQASLFTGGYRIYTAIDMKKQELLQDALDKNLKDFKEVNEEGIYKTQGSGVCIDNATGLVTAIVGGRSQDYDGYTLNRAYQSYRQPGSAIKPVIIYAPYLMSGHTPDEKIDDSPFEGGPRNFDDQYRGEITLTEALAWSSNVCAWKLMEEMTPAYGMSFLHQMKFKKTAVDDNLQAASVGGFTNGVSAVELASAYAALENHGTYRNPTCISKITDSRGSVIIDNTGSEVRVYDENSAKAVTKMMEYGVNYGLLTGAKIDNAIVAAKSGTTNDAKDGWLAGYSRYYTTVVWVGNDMPVAIEGLAGGTYPLYIWKEFMTEIHKGLKPWAFPNYENQSQMIDEGTTQPETTAPGHERETHPGYGGAGMDIWDGDRFITVPDDGDKDVDLSPWRQ